MNPRDDRDNRGHDDIADALRDAWAKLPKAEPSAAVDHAVRNAARARGGRHTPLRLAPVWIAALATAATVAAAVVIVPAMLIRAPEPPRTAGEVEIRLRDSAESAARTMEKAEEASRVTRMRDMPPPAPVAQAPAADGLPADVAESLAAELAGASEAEWRTRLIELRETDPAAAAQLMPAYRERFDLPQSVSLDDLEPPPARQP